MLRIFLALLPALTLCAALAACGSESVPAPERTSASGSSSEPKSSSAPEPVVTEPEPVPEPGGEDPGRNSALDNVPLIDLPDWFESSIWRVDGGMVDNQEMDDAATQQVLDELFCGRLALSMNPDGAIMVLGAGDFTAMCPGKWQSDSRHVAMSFPDAGSYTDYTDFTASLTEVGGQPVMMLAVKENITLYLIPLSTADIPSILGGRQITSVPAIRSSDAWLFTGGLENGQKIGVIEAQGMLDDFSGSMYLEFRQTGRADLIYSTQYIAIPGVWQLQGDVLGFAFYPASGDPVYYTGCFSHEDDSQILILIQNEHYVFYLTLLPDGLGDLPVKRD